MQLLGSDRSLGTGVHVYTWLCKWECVQRFTKMCVHNYAMCERVPLSPVLAHARECPRVMCNMHLWCACAYV